MTRRHQQHANHDDNQLALDFACDTRGALSDRRCTSCPRQGSDEGHDDCRNQQVTSRRARGHEEQRDTDQIAALRRRRRSRNNTSTYPSIPYPKWKTRHGVAGPTQSIGFRISWLRCRSGAWRGTS